MLQTNKYGITVAFYFAKITPNDTFHYFNVEFNLPIKAEKTIKLSQSVFLKHNSAHELLIMAALSHFTSFWHMAKFKLRIHKLKTS